MSKLRSSFAQPLQELDAALARALETETSANAPVLQAMRYALLGGGKRIRALLLLSLAKAFGQEAKEALSFAVALEMIHAYSLVHDDLPAMDDDALRRGKPSCHVAHGEAMAILAGDGLLNAAMEKLLALSAKGPAQAQAASYLAKAAGIHGMIGGQSMDLSLNLTSVQGLSSQAQLALLEELHGLKTGALLTAACVVPGLATRLDAQLLGRLEVFGRALGLAFQIKDDLLDQAQGVDKLGKSQGKDQRDQKLSFVTVLGPKEAQGLFLESSAQALQQIGQLEAAGFALEPLRFLLAFLEERRY